MEIDFSENIAEYLTLDEINTAKMIAHTQSLLTGEEAENIFLLYALIGLLRKKCGDSALTEFLDIWRPLTQNQINDQDIGKFFPIVKFFNLKNFTISDLKNFFPPENTDELVNDTDLKTKELFNKQPQNIKLNERGDLTVTDRLKLHERDFDIEITSLKNRLNYDFKGTS